MTEFSDRTGLTARSHAPKRYLWTDAFGVCNFLELFQQTSTEKYLHKAIALVDQVHTVLGKHRDDDPRSGWISGLDEEEGRRHPTIGGLRIGKKLNERPSGEPYDERLEWDRDGQYFHYLTKWMHALYRVGQITGKAHYHRWALELAKTAHTQFTYAVPSSRKKRMYWKMSIDLSRPQVSSMGHHDPLDALITYLQLSATKTHDQERSPELNLDMEITEALEMCEGVNWFTDDPLGIGGLLTDACTLAQLIIGNNLPMAKMLSKLLDDAGSGLSAFALTKTLHYPATYRLAFRELGISIGLRAIEKMAMMVQDHLEHFPQLTPLTAQLAGFSLYLPLKNDIEQFWLIPENQQSTSWRDHIDINSVMLATSLGPNGYLLIL